MDNQQTIARHIDVTPGTCGGKPRIARTRIRVQDIALWTEQGRSPDQIITDYPQLTHGDVYAVLTYYHDNRSLIERRSVKPTNSSRSSWRAPVSSGRTARLTMEIKYHLDESVANAIANGLEHRFLLCLLFLATRC